MSKHDIDPELAAALWEAGKAAARHLGLGEPEYMTICGRGEEIAMQNEEKTINWRAMTPAQRDETIHEKVMSNERKTVQYEVPSAREGEKVFIASGTTWQNGESYTPRYSQSMDAAWPVLQTMVKRRKTDEPTFELFSAQLFEMASRRVEDADWSMTWGYYILATQWTPEAICIAALRAMGYEVKTEEVN